MADRRITEIAIAHVGLILLLGCGDAAQSTMPLTPSSLTRDASARFQTDSLSYVLRAGSMGYEATLRIVYTNRTASLAAFANCNGATDFAFEKWIDGIWVWAWSPIVPACMSAPITVLPGATHTFPVFLFGGYADCRCAPRFGVEDVSGLYRVVWRSGMGAAQEGTGVAGDSSSVDARVSNRFFLTVPSR